jgi:ribosomal protein L11 methyltransferase
MYCAISAEFDKRLEDSVTGFFLQNISHNLLLEENGKKLKITGYLSARQSGKQKKQMLAEFLARMAEENPVFLRGKATLRYEKEFDWVEEFRRNFQPRQVAPGWWIAPPWKKGLHKNEVIIEPKMAFGTGEHATTQLCCQAACALVKPGMKVLDFGTGSGILSILAARLGASKVVAVDNDSLATENAEENIKLNRVSGRVQVFLGSVDAIPKEKFDLIFANLILKQVKEFFPTFRSVLKRGGLLVVSGILTHQLPELSGFFARNRAVDIAVGRDEDWAALVVSS